MRLVLASLFASIALALAAPAAHAQETELERLRTEARAASRDYDAQRALGIALLRADVLRAQRPGDRGLGEQADHRRHRPHAVAEPSPELDGEVAAVVGTHRVRSPEHGDDPRRAVGRGTGQHVEIARVRRRRQHDQRRIGVGAAGHTSGSACRSRPRGVDHRQVVQRRARERHHQVVDVLGSHAQPVADRGGRVPAASGSGRRVPSASTTSSRSAGPRT